MGQTEDNELEKIADFLLFLKDIGIFNYIYCIFSIFNKL